MACKLHINKNKSEKKMKEYHLRKSLLSGYSQRIASTQKKKKEEEEPCGKQLDMLHLAVTIVYMLFLTNCSYALFTLCHCGMI